MKKKVTIRDVANFTGVSKSTISHFLNGNHKKMSIETKKRIEEAIEILEFKPSRVAKSLATNQSFLVAIVLMDITNPYCAFLLKGIESIFENTEYDLLIMDAKSSLVKEKRALDRALELNVDAVILQPISSNMEDYRFLKDSGKPVAIVDRIIEFENWVNIVPNNYEITKEICNFALKKNYQRAVIFTEPIGKIYPRVWRTKGVIDSFSEYDKLVEVIELKTIEGDIRKYFDKFSEEDGKIFIFANNGKVLLPLIKVLGEKGLLEKVGLSGFDDWKIGEIVRPRLTVIEQPATKIGEIAAEKLYSIIKEQGISKKKIIVEAKIIYRDSV